MMKRSVGLWQLMGFAFAVFCGTILHFLYEWLDGAKWIAPFSGVNESTWEHMKLLFWPMLIFSVVQSFFFRGRKDFYCIKLRGILLGIGLIPIVFYTYNGAIGKSPDWLNIAIFFICALTAYLYEWKLLKRSPSLCPPSVIPISLICLIAMLFVIFTFAPLRLGIFKDPVSGGYGILT